MKDNVVCSKLGVIDYCPCHNRSYKTLSYRVWGGSSPPGFPSKTKMHFPFHDRVIINEKITKLLNKRFVGARMAQSVSARPWCKRS